MEETVRKHIAEHDFFAGLSDSALDFLAEHARELTLETKQMLFREGEPASSFYVVRAGGITVEIPGVYGPSLEVQNLSAGEVLGWSWFVPPYEWDFQAFAEQPSELIQLDGAAIREHCEADSDFGFQLLKRFTLLMSQRLTVARQRMMNQFSPPGFA